MIEKGRRKAALFDVRRMASEPGLEEAQRLEARHAVAADDQVVVDGDAQGPAGVDHLAGHIDVRAGRRRIAGRVVVEEPTKINK